MSPKKLIYGVGINDADYKVRPVLSVNGPRGDCLFYRTWKSMLERCYYELFQKKHPSYIGCKVVEEWHLFSNFKRWMEQQDWEGMHLDKDILVKGNRVYGPDTCVFVSREVNMFLLDSAKSRGEYPIGVGRRPNGTYYAHIHDITKGRQRWLGTYKTPEEAYEAWRSAKYTLAANLAEKQDDPRVAQALLMRYIE